MEEERQMNLLHDKLNEESSLTKEFPLNSQISINSKVILHVRLMDISNR